jgi:hypothetical protein
MPGLYRACKPASDIPAYDPLLSALYTSECRYRNADVRFRRSVLAAVARGGVEAERRCHEDRDQHNDHEQLDQGEAVVFVPHGARIGVPCPPLEGARQLSSA